MSSSASLPIRLAPPPPTAAPATETPTSQPTASASPTETETPSATATESATAGASPSPVATETATPASSETTTPAPSETATATPTASETVSATVTVMPAITSTVTVTPTVTITPTATLTASVPITSTPPPEIFQISPSGGQLQTANGVLQVAFPAGAISAPIAVTYTVLPSAGDGPAALKEFGYVFALTAATAGGLGLSPTAPVSRFAQPLTLTLNLAALGFKPGKIDGRLVWFGYQDDTTGDWIPIAFDLAQTDDSATLQAQVDHFTNFGVKGEANPGWSLKFDEPIVALANGAATYRYDFTLPPGRNGLQPALSLSYNSRNADHLKSWFQTDWVGEGWSLDSIEIVRRLGPSTTQTEGECTAQFSLTFNGTGYSLIQGSGNRYYTQEDSQLYIQLFLTGAANPVGSYWIVRTPDNTLYRLGYTTESAQLIRCKDDANRRVFRWRLDKALDVYGNQMKLDYAKDPRTNCPGSSGPTDIDRASYLTDIYYNNLDLPSNPGSNYPTSWASRILFVRTPRPSSNLPDDGYGSCDKLFFQSYFLDELKVYHNGAVIRSYDLEYGWYTDQERAAHGGLFSRELGAITERGHNPANANDVLSLPKIGFSYVHVAASDVKCTPGLNCGEGPGGCPGGYCPYNGSYEWVPGPGNGTWDCGYSPTYGPGNPADCYNYVHGRLYQVYNGYGAITTFIYGHDGRGGFWYDGYNYRVVRRLITADRSGSATWEYQYGQPCYDTGDAGALGPGGVKCQLPAPSLNAANLLAHDQVTVTVRNYDTSELSVSKHFFNLGSSSDPALNKLVGRETQVETFDGSGNLLQRQTSTYSYQDLTNPTRWAVHLDSQVSAQCAGAAGCLNRKTEYLYDAYNNITQTLEYRNNGTIPYRRTLAEYYPSVISTTWLINEPARQQVQIWTGSVWTLAGETRFLYDGDGPGDWNTTPGPNGQPSAQRTCATIVSEACTSWVDASTQYHAVWTGLPVTQTTFDSYGTGSAFASSNPRLNTTAYDNALHLYPTVVTNSVGLTTTTGYDLYLGLPLTVTDANGSPTYTRYDKLGRPLAVVRPGDSVQYPTTSYVYNDTLSTFHQIKVPDHDMELGSGWRTSSGDTSWVSYDTSQAHSGVRSFKIDKPGAAWPDWVGQDGLATWQANTTYRVSAWFKTTSSGTISLQYSPNGASGPFTQAFDATGTWQRLTLTFTTGASDETNGILRFFGSGTVFVDDVYVQARPLKVETWQRETSGCSTCLLPVFAYYDGVGRTIQTRAETTDGTEQAVVNTLYDALGRATASYLPAFEPYTTTYSLASGWDTRPKTTTTYDALGRTLSVTAPDGALSQSAYGLDTTAQYGITATTGLLLQSLTDPNGHYRQQVSDAFGRMVVVREFTGDAPANYALYATTRYSYDALDHLVTVTDTLGVTTTLQYNTLGQKVGMVDPDMGHWLYTYTAAGNLETQIDARGQTLWLAYDAADRLTQKRQDGPSGAVLANYAYDSAPLGRGLQAEIANDAVRTTWAYDARGRVLSETKVLTGTGSYTTLFTYDALDRPITTTYPTGEQVTSSYTNAGQLSQVQGLTGTVSYASGLAYNALGQLTTLLLGNGVTITNTYDPLSSRLLTNVSARYPQTPTLSLAYTYDLAGNITRITDTTRSEVNNYQYDSLDRLTWITTTATAGGLVYQQLYRYGPTGNITSVGSGLPDATHEGYGALGGGLSGLGSGRGGFTGLVGGSAAGVFARGGGLVDGVFDPMMYAYADPAHVHAVTAVTGLGTFSYDANGNMTRRVDVQHGTTYTQTFDLENRLVSVAVSGGGTTIYQYDAGGQMIRKVAPDGTVTVYLGLVEYEISGGSVTKTTSYYAVPGARVVRVSGTLSYVLTDHLGSSSVTLDDAGGVVGELRYFAYGETRVSSGSTPTEHLYTGQVEHASVGLYYFNARWYQAALARFVSADTLVPGPANPQAFNRYSYALANPIRYADPSGHAIACGTDVGNGCEGFGPSRILTSYGYSQYDQIRQDVALRNFARTHRNYSAAADPMLDDTGRMVVANAQFQAAAMEVKPNFPALFASGAGLGLAAIVAGGGQDDIGQAMAAQGLVGNTGRGNPTIATIPDGSIRTHSGWLERPGYAQTTSEVLAEADGMGFSFPAGDRDRGVPGRYGASHAEPQLSVAAPNQPIGVSNEMCPSCQDYFSALARSRGTIQTVADPYYVRVFYPDGTIRVLPR